MNSPGKSCIQSHTSRSLLAHCQLYLAELPDTAVGWVGIVAVQVTSCSLWCFYLPPTVGSDKILRFNEPQKIAKNCYAVKYPRFMLTSMKNKKKDFFCNYLVTNINSKSSCLNEFTQRRWLKRGWSIIRLIYFFYGFGFPCSKETKTLFKGLQVTIQNHWRNFRDDL